VAARGYFLKGWFASCFVHRTQKFAVPLVLIFTGNNGKNVAVHGFAQATAMVFFMPLITPYLASTSRTSFINFFLWIIILCLAVFISFPIIGSFLAYYPYNAFMNWLLKETMLIIGIGVSIISYMAFMQIWVAVRRDWPIQLSKDRNDLTSLNMELQALELMADLIVGTVSTCVLYLPTIFTEDNSMMKGYKYAVGLAITACSLGLIIYAKFCFNETAKTYSLEVARSQEELTTTKQLNAGSLSSINKVRDWHVKLMPAICSSFWKSRFVTPYYVMIHAFKSPINLVMIPMILTHFDVLNPGNGLLSFWLVSQSIPLYIITASKTVTAGIGGIAVMAVPFITRHLKSESLCTAILFSLSTALMIVTFQLMQQFDDTTEKDEKSLVNPAYYCLLIIMISKVFLYMFNVGANGIFQHYTTSERRGLFNGVLMTGENIMRIIQMGIGTVLPFVALVKICCFLFPVGAMSLSCFCALPERVRRTKDERKKILRQLESNPSLRIYPKGGSGINEPLI